MYGLIWNILKEGDEEAWNCSQRDGQPLPQDTHSAVFVNNRSRMKKELWKCDPQAIPLSFKAGATVNTAGRI
jgi:hypothetical protein